MKYIFRKNLGNEERKELDTVLENVSNAFIAMMKDARKVNDLLSVVIHDVGSRFFSLRTSLLYFNVNDMSATIFSCVCYKINESLSKFVKCFEHKQNSMSLVYNKDYALSHTGLVSYEIKAENLVSERELIFLFTQTGADHYNGLSTQTIKSIKIQII